MEAIYAEDLRNQLVIARTEIQNLRQQLRSLSFAQQTDLRAIKGLLKDYKCPSCKENISSPTSENEVPQSKEIQTIDFRPIGTIRTEFAEKRAVPRQSSICSKLLGCVELNKEVFNNPEHSLNGLEGFSHLWIIYHFHKNEAHAKAKVAPPRLKGERVGIFSTRSPHRPCPIGLSLVEIDHIDGKDIYFYGIDMVDGTPVLDLKPYIPQYDNPLFGGQESRAVSAEDRVQLFDAREEPDGEENAASGTAASQIRPMSQFSGASLAKPMSSCVKVPQWIASDAALEVLFNDRANGQIAELQVNRTNIVDILKTDPRSVYLRTRYGSQIFTFQLGDVSVTCKFDDANATVTVVQIRKFESLNGEHTQNLN